MRANVAPIHLLLLLPPLGRPAPISPKPWQPEAGQGDAVRTWAPETELLNIASPDPGSRRRSWRDFAAARRAVQQEGDLATRDDYMSWRARPADLPSNPEKVYRATGWAGWRDFLHGSPEGRVCAVCGSPAISVGEVSTDGSQWNRLLCRRCGKGAAAAAAEQRLADSAAAAPEEVQGHGLAGLRLEQPGCATELPRLLSLAHRCLECPQVLLPRDS